MVHSTGFLNVDNNNNRLLVGGAAVLLRTAKRVAPLVKIIIINLIIMIKYN